ncbi:DUF4247 domain-containing protein [Mycobacterium hubeiense]|uniref:DUF4247 domain-containing protein n=1 Tax=Mycobacterium hubeiense TaxID=1867256 RepID=UPI000C7F4353|nr:DUF4247 domain-containing protein [Mycobacterium sp. QGD 101]
MSRTGLFVTAAVLLIAGVGCLILGISMLRDIRGYVADNYRMYSDGRYECDGAPQEIADKLSAYKEPEARAVDRGSEYLRYDNDIVVVGPDAGRSCTVQVEDINERYSHGGFIYLGPGFTPGSPAGGAGGSPGGPDDAK